MTHFGSPGCRFSAVLAVVLCASQPALAEEEAGSEEAAPAPATPFDQVAAQAWEAPRDIDGFSRDVWDVMTGSADGSDEFERRRNAAALADRKKELLSRWVMFEAKEVELSEYDFKRRRFTLSVEPLVSTPVNPVNWSFQDIASINGTSATVMRWMMNNRDRLKRPVLYLSAKSDDEAEAWRKEHPGKFTAKLVCKLGKTWKVGSTVYGLEGMSTRSCHVRFLDQAGEPVGDVKL